MTEHKRVLIVEDDDTVRRTLERVLKREGCEVFEARDGQEGAERLDGGLAVDLVITDLKMPRADGRAVLAAGVRRQLPVVILTGYATVETAVEMMHNGAATFLMKPFNPDSVRGILEGSFGIIRRPAATAPTALVVRGTAHKPQEVVPTGENPRFLAAKENLESAADSEATVLILGESGTGKELAARMIHNFSPRAGGRFVAVNCGAIPEQLIESELFGHKKGAFTDATQSRTGRFQDADGGTIFLDEIGDTPLAFQVKLLRVLEERAVVPLGENTPKPIDVRVIAATHRDLRAMVDESKFRLDLFHRLNVVDVHLPALRDRRSDIPLLVEQFLRSANERHGRSVTGLTEGVLAAFDAYGWPGNIRELANVVERMVVLKRTRGEVTVADLPPQLTSRTPPSRAGGAAGPSILPAEGLDLRKDLADREDALIDQALERTRGNRNAAAHLLGLNRTTLVEKLRRRGDKSDDKSSDPEG
ncbi:MAG: sigma-54-dependent Fis family transcriptional regulator [Myxococcales bacterium]|nr:sigma-54-dependent Fis family transcriptional regulator [Myxococcales bacterium]